MKKILTILLSLVAFGAFAQTLTYEELMRLEPKSHGKIEHYVASDGATYSIGDTIVIGQPSLNNDMFLTMQSALGIAATVLGGGWQTTSGASSANLNSYYIGKPIIINKIEYEVDKRGGEREVSVRGLVTGVGNVRCYMFEQALANGEIVSIGKQKQQLESSKREHYLKKLKEAKELLDLELITQEEFDAIKAECAEHLKLQK